MRRRMPNNKCVGGHSAGRKLQILVGGQEVGVHVKMRVVEEFKTCLERDQT
jgi:hypothetical protein